MAKPLFVFSVALSLVFASCGENNNGIFPVSGKVTCQGRPAAGAVIFFRRHGGAAVGDPLVMGIVQPDGSFELVCGSSGKGAPPGDYDVMIQWRQPSPHRGGSWRTGPDRLAGRYSDPNRPMLHAKVEAEENQLSPFDLTVESRVPNG